MSPIFDIESADGEFVGYGLYPTYFTFPIWEGIAGLVPVTDEVLAHKNPPPIWTEDPFVYQGLMVGRGRSLTPV